MRVRVQAAPDESAWGWELGFGLVGLGTDNQGEEGEGGKEGRSCLLHLQPATYMHLQMQMQILIRDGRYQDGGRGRVVEWGL